MAGCLDCPRILANASRESGTTAFERVFMSQVPSAKDSILVQAELLEGEPHLSLEDMEGNVAAAVAEHRRLREVLTRSGLWEEVEVDIRANHLRWIDEEPQTWSSWFQGPTNGSKSGNDNVPASEPSSAFLAALNSMPAFEHQAAGVPRWQVIVSQRRLALHIHHAAVDGVSLALIAATLLLGLRPGEAAQAMQKAQVSRAPNRCVSKFAAGVCDFVRMLSSFAHINCVPFYGFLCPQRASPVTAPASEASIKDIRYVHLGPYPLLELKAAARSQGVTVNSVLLAAVTDGIRDYCMAQGGRVPAMNVLIPVNFKRPSPTEPKSLKANNDFSTMFISVPNADTGFCGSSAGMKDSKQKRPVPNPSQWSRGNATGAWAASAVLSLMPPCFVRWLVPNATRRAVLIFSNVDGSQFGDTLICQPSNAHRRIRVHAYGSLNGTIRVFCLVNSHGNDLHFGLTVDRSVVKDRSALAACVHEHVVKMIGSCAEPSLEA